MNIEEFKNKKKKKRISILDKFKNEILELWNDNYSQAAIVEFLASNDVKTTQPNLSLYLSRISKNSTTIGTTTGNERTALKVQKPQTAIIKKKQEVTSKSKEEVKKALEDMDVFFPRNREN